jgi:hypothetical protein
LSPFTPNPRESVSAPHTSPSGPSPKERLALPSFSPFLFTLALSSHCPLVRPSPPLPLGDDAPPAMFFSLTRLSFPLLPSPQLALSCRGRRERGERRAGPSSQLCFLLPDGGGFARGGR